LARLWSLVRVEDLLLFGWLVLVQPLVFGRDAGSGFRELSQDGGVVAGAAYLAAAAGGFVCLATRSVGAEAVPIGTLRSPQSYAPLPFIGALAFITVMGLEQAKIADAEGALLPVAALMTGCLLLREKTPPLPAERRRALIAPFVLLAAGIFNGTMADVLGSVDAGDLFSGGAGSGEALLLAVLLPASLVYYLAFVFAPRQMAESEGSWPAWTLRYALYLAGALGGVGWMRVLGS